MNAKITTQEGVTVEVIKAGSHIKLLVGESEAILTVEESKQIAKLLRI